MFLDTDSRTRTIYPRRLNKVFSLKFPECYPDQQTPDFKPSEQVDCSQHSLLRWLKS